MARTGPRKSTQPIVISQAPPVKGCRDCWQANQQDLYHLPCGHAVCAHCVAESVRVAMTLPSCRLPLRCCQQFVPVAVLAQVLSSTELAFYQHLTQCEVEKKQTYVANAETPSLAAPCDFCGLVTPLASDQDVDKLQPCGHVYCGNCYDNLRQTVGPGERFCCHEAPISTTTSDSAVPAVVELFPTAKKAKGKQKAQTVDAMVDKVVGTVDVNAIRCVACSMRLEGIKTAVYLPCGHAFCRACLKQRCQRAVVNEDQCSIGVPVRCCDQLVPVENLGPALGKRLFPKYEALVAKRAEAVAVVVLSQAKKRKANANATVDTKRQRTTDAPEPSTSCVSCLQDIEASDQLRGPCGHLYCVACVTTMAQLSLDDRALVPIRCCGQEFPIEYVHRVLPKRKAAQYDRFVTEKDWRQSDLKSDHEYARAVKKLRGKQCPTCGIGVQKIHGCHTMHCPHGHYFCWKCVSTTCVCGSSAQH